MGHSVRKISILRNPEDQILSSWDFFRHIGELDDLERAIKQTSHTDLVRVMIVIIENQPVN